MQTGNHYYNKKAAKLHSEAVRCNGKYFTKRIRRLEERIRRGIYRHKDGTISNADINGAANIMRKVFPNIKEWDRGVVDTPYALKIA